MANKGFRLVEELVSHIKGLYPDIRIYLDEVEQGFKEPCFFIHVVDTKYTPEANKYVKVRSKVDLSYFPPKKKRSECLAMQEELSYKLLHLPTIHLFDRQYEGVDNVLHCIFNASTRLKLEEEDIKQRELKVKEEVKDG